MKKAVIIGAGPAGLAAAYRLCERKINTLIIEKDSGVGGLSRTTQYKGCYFDIGGHRFFTKNKLVLAWWQGLLKENFLRVPRHSRVYYNGKFFNYPLSITNVLFKLGAYNFFAIPLSYLRSRLLPFRGEDSFEKCIKNKFGNRLYQIFFKGYTEKIWGISCAQISTDWADQRIKGLSLSRLLRDTVSGGKDNAVKTLTREFYYPHQGSGMMYEAAARRVMQNGGQIKFDSEVIRIRHDNKVVTGLTCKDTRDGSLFEVEGTDFCSSMPLDLLVLRMEPLPDKQYIDICRQLKYRSLLMVYLILKRKELFRDNWIYINSADVKVARIQNYKNWSPDMASSPDISSLGLEYFCDEGDPAWSQSDEGAIETAAQDLEKLKIADREDILEAFVLRVPKAYPVYERNYRQLVGAIKEFIGRFSNLHCMGRYGMFRYNNMDHSILTGFLAADNILGANNDLWNINTEQSYHEEFDRPVTKSSAKRIL